MNKDIKPVDAEHVITAERWRYAVDVEKRFTYHPPKGDQVDRYQQIRDGAKAFAFLLAETCPDSRELTRAVNKLEEAVMLANAAIARNE